MVMVSLHSNRNPKMEVDIRDCCIVVIGWTMFLFGELWILGLWVKKVEECFNWGLMSHSSRSMEDSGAEGLNCGGPDQEVSEKNFSMWPRD